MNLLEIFSIILTHWIADFVLQTDKQAKGKSKNWNDLLGHTLTYSVCWWIMLFFMSWMSVAAFIGATFIFHTATDYFTSRLNSKLLPKRELVHCYDDINVWKINKNESWHKFFVSVGFDQVLHYIQLFTTYYYLKDGI